MAPIRRSLRSLLPVAPMNIRNYETALKYAAGHGDVAALMAELNKDPENNHKPGSNLRLVTADALDDVGRHREAEHMRSRYPLSVRDGKVQTSTLRLHRMLSQMRRYYGGEHIQGGKPSDLRLEAARELESIGRHHEAAILRSENPINTHTGVHPPPGVSHTVTGDFDRYAWLGGGEIVYAMADGGFLCHDCMNGQHGSLACHPTTPDDPQWHLNHDFIHEEGPPLNCDHCNREIESAYGDPNRDD